jgi:kynurenine formamidase
MEAYPGDPEVEITQFHTIPTAGWRLKRLTLGSHSGTHVDAPSHMAEEGITLDQISLDKFFGKAVHVSLEDDFPQGLGLIFSEGTLEISLMEKIKTAKTPFVVTGGNSHLDIDMERALLTGNIITFTDLINLEQLPKNSVLMFYGIPLKIKDGDGSPVRAFAIIE